MNAHLLTTAIALGEATPQVTATGHARLRDGALSVQIDAGGHADLSVWRDDQPVLSAYVQCRPEDLTRTITAAHAHTIPTPVELTQLQGALARLTTPEMADAVLARLRLAPTVGHATPWGDAETCVAVHPGVYHVRTRRHAGYWADAEVQAQLPEEARRADGWYEGDIDGAILAAFLGWGRGDREREAGIHAVLMRNHPDLVVHLRAS